MHVIVIERRETGDRSLFEFVAAPAGIPQVGDRIAHDSGSWLVLERSWRVIGADKGVTTAVTLWVRRP